MIIEVKKTKSKFVMKNNIRHQLVVLTFLALSTLNSQVSTVFAQAAQFFRIAGPAATKITAFQRDGTMVWSNAQPGAAYTVQTVAALPGGSNWTNYVQIPVTTGVNTNIIAPAGMALIPAGSFTMGDTLDGESDAVPTNITVSAFYMDTNLVSYGQWQSVYNWAISHGYGFLNAGDRGPGYVNGVPGNVKNQPVESVDWYDAAKWCNARSQQAGALPVYYTDAGLTQVYTNGEVPVYMNWTAKGYRLPTEAEWEKAARGGLSGQRFPWGNTISESQANYFGKTNVFSYDFGPDGFNAAFDNQGNPGYPYTSPVGYFAANGYGLYDMAGNEYVWCWDWYAAPPYPTGSPYLGGSDPTGPASGSERVLRGGNWSSSAAAAHCASRWSYNPDDVDATQNSLDISFRCVRGL
jgi:formylglycine-generating enzyme required for sulfatase activity